MSAAEQLAPHIPKIPSTPSLSGIPHYDQNVFPRVAKGEKVFNWVAGIFAGFWLPYKGLWGTCAKWVLPWCIFSPLLEMLNPAANLGLAIGVIVGVGFEANKAYYKKCKTTPLGDNGHWGRGIAGFLLLIVVGVLAEGFWGGFVPAFQESFHKSASRAASTSPSRAPAHAQTKVYTQSAMALMDGEDAIGSTMKITVTYMGIQRSGDQVFINALDSQSGTYWWVTFEEKHRAAVAQMEIMQAFIMECEITHIDDVYKVCALN